MTKTILTALAMLLLFATNAMAQIEPQRDTIPPEFPGGAKGWLSYLEKNIQYPAKALKKNFQGKVNIEFMVNETGKVSDVKPLTNLGYGLEKEAVRLIATGPDWIPATLHGEKIKYRLVQSFTFRLE